MKPAHDVQARPQRIRHDAGRPRKRGHPRQQPARSVEHAELVGGERRDIDSLAVRGPAHAGGKPERRVALRLRAGRDRVVDVGIELDLDARRARTLHDREPLLGEVAAEVRLQALLQDRVGARHRRLGGVHRARRHAHQDGRDVAARRERIRAGVEIDHLVERNLVGNLRVPQVAGLIHPAVGAALHDQPDLGRRRQRRVERRVRRRQRIARLRRRQRRGLGARVEHVDQHLGAVQVARQRPRHAGGDRHHLGRRGEVRGIVDLDRVLLRHAHVRPARRAGEHDVARLVAHAQRGARLEGSEIDDAHVVGQVVHDPGFTVRAGRHRHRLEPHRDLGDAPRRRAGDVEHRQPAVGGIDDEQLGAVGRERRGMHVAALEVHEVGVRRDPGREVPGDGRGAERHGDQCQQER